MFNIDNAVSEWRKQMLAAGVKNASVLNELSEHLRSDVEQQMRSGVDAEFAFSRAVERIGAASQVREEFSKVRPRTGAGFESWFSVGLVMLLIATVLGCELVFSALRMSFLQQASAFAALTLIFVVACGWRYAMPYFPVVEASKRPWAIVSFYAITFVLIWLAASVVPNVVANLIEQAPTSAANNSILWLIWGGVLMALCVCSGLALLMDREARQHWGMHAGGKFKQTEHHV
ncbi:MAG: hypothetical protein JWO95_3026 [Verrucomicrobiales bacterium]|nr:hypothetical protein [Verrucomicrobiales bacterium]